MQFLSVKETALCWGVTERYVQKLCVEGRIPGAEKLAGVWMIPAEAARPSDGRHRTSAERETPAMPTAEAPPSLLRGSLMPLLDTPFVPGRCEEALGRIEDPALREIAEAEYAYFSGQAARAAMLAERYLEEPALHLRLSACFIYAYANLAEDHIEGVRRALGIVRATLGDERLAESREAKALSVFVSTAAAVLLHLPLSEEMPPLKQFICCLPSGLRLFALYVQAHYAYLQGEYGASIGIVETALALEETLYPIPTIYLHLVATMDYMSMKHPERAKAHLLAAWELAKPDDLIEPFGEHHGLLGGMLEATLKRDYPADFKRIIAITYRFSAGWRKIHNAETGHRVADDLSTTEFTVAMLAARGWLNKEIAAHLGISENTVKQHISVTLQKLGIAQRSELADFMLK